MDTAKTEENPYPIIGNKSKNKCSKLPSQKAKKRISN